MIDLNVHGDSKLLRNQVNDLERQVVKRRRRVRARVVGANQEVAARLASPGMLLAAVGVGVAVEQASHHRGWSVATPIKAISACIGLLVALKSLGQQTSGSVQRPES